MKIIVDAMGGDNAPDAYLLGAFRAAKELNTDILLVGKGGQLLMKMKELGYDTLPDRVEISNAEETVEMHDEPSNIVRTKRNSSMVQGLRMLAEGAGDAFVSAGNTGALLSAATLVAKRIRGIRRGAFCPAIPTKTGQAVIIDAGANTECTPEFLLQFGCMGSIYAEKMLGIARPRVGLLNNGAESTKGDTLRKETYALLTAAAEKGLIFFTGNVEARDVPLGAVDVVVCDGFTGNVLLKTVEGTALFMGSMVKEIFYRNLLTKIGGLFCKKGTDAMKKKMDYRETGGSVLLGISKPVIKAHGSSDELAVFGAIRQAMLAVESGVCDTIRENIGVITAAGEKQSHAEA